MDLDGIRNARTIKIDPRPEGQQASESSRHAAGFLRKRRRARGDVAELIRLSTSVMAAADDSDDDVPEAEQRRRASLCLYAHGDDASRERKLK